MADYPQRLNVRTPGRSAFGQIKQEEISDEPNPPPPDKSWGYHLLLDMSGCNDQIDDKQTIATFINDLMDKLDMLPMPGCELQIATDIKEQDRGTSAVQLITTSSITYHSDDDGRALYLDVFTCRYVADMQRIVIGLVNEYFEPQRIGGRFLTRDAGFTNKSYRHEKLPPPAP